MWQKYDNFQNDLSLSSYLTYSNPANGQPSRDKIWFIDCRTEQVSCDVCFSKEHCKARVRQRDQIMGNIKLNYLS